MYSGKTMENTGGHTSEGCNLRKMVIKFMQCEQEEWLHQASMTDRQGMLRMIEHGYSTHNAFVCPSSHRGKPMPNTHSWYQIRVYRTIFLPQDGGPGLLATEHCMIVASSSVIGCPARALFSFNLPPQKSLARGCV